MPVHSIPDGFIDVHAHIAPTSFLKEVHKFGKSFGVDIFLSKYNALWIVRGSGCIHNRGQRLLIDGFWINDFGFVAGRQKVMPLIMVI